MPYTKKKIDNGLEFDVHPEKAPQIIGTLLLACLLPLLVLMCVGIAVVLVAVAFVVGAGYLMQKGKTYTQYRHPSKFQVTAEGVSISDKFYDKEDIHRIIIRNHVDKYEYIPNVTIRPSNYGTLSGLAARFKIKEQLINVSYRVDMETNGTPVALAGGLTEPTAYAVLSDVCKILGFKIE